MSSMLCGAVLQWCYLCKRWREGKFMEVEAETEILA